MTYTILLALLLFAAWLVRACIADIRVELAQLTTCAHCGGALVCRRSCCGGAVDVAAPCRECNSSGRPI